MMAFNISVVSCLEGNISSTLAISSFSGRPEVNGITYAILTTKYFAPLSVSSTFASIFPFSSLCSHVCTQNRRIGISCRMCESTFKSSTNAVSWKQFEASYSTASFAEPHSFFWSFAAPGCPLPLCQAFKLWCTKRQWGLFSINDHKRAFWNYYSFK